MGIKILRYGVKFAVHFRPDFDGAHGAKDFGSLSMNSDIFPVLFFQKVTKTSSVVVIRCYVDSHS